jgi:hypothetical protein
MEKMQKRAMCKQIIVFLTVFAAALLMANMLSYLEIQSAQGQITTILTVTGYAGTTKEYSLDDLKAMPAITMYGGFYQPNQKQINNGLYTGVSLYNLCNQSEGITATCNITVLGQGTNSFTYDMVANGLGFNSAYKTYNNITGEIQNQTQPITLILAYQANGTDLPTSWLPAPRLLIVGPEGLLMDGSGGRSITQINITNNELEQTPSPSPIFTLSPTQTPSQTPTATPSPSLTVAPSSTPTPTLIIIPTPTVESSPSPTLTPTPTSNPTSTKNSTPTPFQTTSPSSEVNLSPSITNSEPPKIGTDSGQLPIYSAVAAAIIVVAIIVTLTLRSRRKQ